MNKPARTIKAALERAKQQLSPCEHVDQSRLEAEILLAHCLQKDRSYLIAWPDEALTETQLNQFKTLIQERLDGQPIAHLIGHKEFWSMPLTVTADTLIPRPETERLIEIALDFLKPKSQPVILDLATGSGAIALALAKELPQAKVCGSDISLAALDIAQLNARHHQLSQIEWIESNLFEQLGHRSYDLIVSNPPYVADDDPHLQQGDVRFEPGLALRAGPDGLDCIRLIIDQARDYLHPAGALLLEHGYDQQDAIIDLLTRANYHNIKPFTDYQNQPRALLAALSDS